MSIQPHYTVGASLSRHTKTAERLLSYRLFFRLNNILHSWGLKHATDMGGQGHTLNVLCANISGSTDIHNCLEKDAYGFMLVTEIGEHYGKIFSMDLDLFLEFGIVENICPSGSGDQTEVLALT